MIIIQTNKYFKFKQKKKIILAEEGSLFMELQSQIDSTNLFELKKGVNTDGVFTFTKNEANIGAVSKLNFP